MRTLTYCTNVHPSGTLDALLCALAGPVSAVARRVRSDPCPLTPALFPLGVWLSNRTVRELASRAARARLSRALARGRLRIVSINAFPFGNFHGRTVKRAVYRPDWADPARLAYTAQLAERLEAILEEGEDGTEIPVSTLPVGYKPHRDGAAFRRAAAENLARAALAFSRLADARGRRFTLALEPEPFGTVETTAETIRFFREWIFRAGLRALTAARPGLSRARAETVLRQHLGICFDTCHLAVQFEDLPGSYERLVAAEIPVAKVQVASGLGLRAAGAETVERLFRFAEPRYLHQVSAKGPDGRVRRWEDLPHFLNAIRNPKSKTQNREVRVHFHVPVCWKGAGGLSTTRPDLARLLTHLAKKTRAGHPIPLLEIETYTWEVLPEPPADEAALAEGIAREFVWTHAFFTE